MDAPTRQAACHAATASAYLVTAMPSHDVQRLRGWPAYSEVRAGGMLIGRTKSKGRPWGSSVLSRFERDVRPVLLPDPSASRDRPPDRLAETISLRPLCLTRAQATLNEPSPFTPCEPGANRGRALSVRGTGTPASAPLRDAAVLHGPHDTCRSGWTFAVERALSAAREGEMAVRPLSAPGRATVEDPMG